MTVSEFSYEFINCGTCKIFFHIFHGFWDQPSVLLIFWTNHSLVRSAFKNLKICSIPYKNLINLCYHSWDHSNQWCPADKFLGGLFPLTPALWPIPFSSFLSVFLFLSLFSFFFGAPHQLHQLPSFFFSFSSLTFSFYSKVSRFLLLVGSDESPPASKRRSTRRRALKLALLFWEAAC